MRTKTALSFFIFSSSLIGLTPAMADSGDLFRASVGHITSSQGNGASRDPALSADGRYIAFTSEATDLVAGDTNGSSDIFLRDTQSNTTTRISLSSAGLEGSGGSFNSALSADGRYIAFESEATNLVANDTNGSNDVFVHETSVSVAGDCNGNGGLVDIQDVICTINKVLGD